MSALAREPGLANGTRYHFLLIQFAKIAIKVVVLVLEGQGETALSA